MFRRITLILLVGIVLLGAILRIINLANNPPGFFADEAVIGVDAYSLLRHGTDHLGNNPHLLFPALGDWRGFVQIVTATPFVALFGLTENAVRMTSAVYGIGTIILIFLVTGELFGASTALIAALLLAVSPWHIHISRMGFEFASFPFWFLLSAWLFIKGIKNRTLYIFSFLCFGITLYTYQPARLFVPVMLTALLVIYRTRADVIRHMLLGGVLFFLFAIPLVINISEGGTLRRFRDTSIFFQQAPLPQKILSVAKTYGNYFSVDFLFTKGDSRFPGQFITRHSLPGIGLLYLAQIPFLAWGLLLAFRGWKSRPSRLLFTWLILYPVAGALVGNIVPYATRGIIGVIPLQILTANGIYALFRTLSRQAKRFVTVAVLLCISAGLFSLNQYLASWRAYPQNSADYWGWQYGARPIMEYFLQNINSYDDLYLPPAFNAPDIFIQFYDPGNLCQNKCTVGDLKRYNPKRKQLFAVPVDQIAAAPKGTIVETVYYTTQSPAFYILRTPQ